MHRTEKGTIFFDKLLLYALYLVVNFIDVFVSFHQTWQQFCCEWKPGHNIEDLECTFWVRQGNSTLLWSEV